MEVLERLHEVLPGRLLRLTDWFLPSTPSGGTLPINPRVARPLPPLRS
jgi:hypothetical protein